MPDLELSVTICSWNTIEDTRACLQSLENVRDELPFEVILIDNNSEDSSAEMVESEFPWVRLYKLQRNLGFTGGHNYALERILGKHAFLLNSDAVVYPGTLSTLVEFADKNPDVGIVGPKILNPDGSLQLSCRTFPNPIAALFRSTPIGKLFPNSRVLRDYLMTDWSHDSSREVDWVSGAAMLISETHLTKAGALDPDYFMYCEDVDICWRSWKAGLKVIYLPSAVCTHAIGRSTDKAVNTMLLRHHKSMLLFYKKNMLPQRFFVLRPLLYAGAAAALALRMGVLVTKNKRDAFRRRMAAK